jgi:fibronectin-binding autotransporter adhesin
MHKTITVALAITLAILLIFNPSSVQAGTWTIAGGGSWATAANWNGGLPNATGDNATFNNAASGANAAQSGNRGITLDNSKTVGSVTFNNDAANSFTNTISAGSPTTSALIFDETGAGPATISVPAAVGTGNNTISAPMTLTDSVVANVSQVTASSAAGALNLTGTMGGAGGFTKNGDGLATFGTGAKTYTGATVLNGGRMRISNAAQPSATSGFTINSGGQLTLISAGTYTLGSGTLTLNGAGPTSGPFAPFPGAIRPDTSLIITIANAVNLNSDSVVHSQGLGTASITFSGAVSGGGKLIVGSAAHDANIGNIILTGSNSYSGGSKVQAGTLVAGAASVNAFGTGNVTVDSANLVFGGSAAKLQIQTGATNAIADTAILSLAGGNAAGVADDGSADLGAGINELIGGLVLGGTTQTNFGTYGSVASGATYQFDEYFSGTGVVTLVPEPSCMVLLCLAASGLVASRRKR